MIYAYTRLRYQVSVYRTIGPPSGFKHRSLIGQALAYKSDNQRHGDYSYAENSGLYISCRKIALPPPSPLTLFIYSKGILNV